MDGRTELAWHIRAIAYMLSRIKTGIKSTRWSSSNSLDLNTRYFSQALTLYCTVRVQPRGKIKILCSFFRSLCSRGLNSKPETGAKCYQRCSLDSCFYQIFKVPRLCRFSTDHYETCHTYQRQYSPSRYHGGIFDLGSNK